MSTGRHSTERGLSICSSSQNRKDLLSCDTILNSTYVECLAFSTTEHCIFLWLPEHCIFPQATKLYRNAFRGTFSSPHLLGR